MKIERDFDLRCWKSNKMAYICSANNPTMSEDRIKTLETNQEKLINSIESLLQMTKALVQAVDENFTEVKAKIDALEVKVDSLDVSTDKNFKDVKWELKKDSRRY